MRQAKPFRRQQFFLLAFTLSILGIAILLLNLRDQSHSELFERIGNHQLIVYHVQKGKEELRAIEQYLLLRQLHTRADTGGFELSGGFTISGGFNRSVSIHVLRNHIEELLRLQKETESHGPLSRKLERQFDALLGPDSPLVTGETAEQEGLGRRIEGMLLSMEQLEDLHGLQIKTLTQRQARVTRLDTLALFVLVAMLVILSYLSIAWTMGRIRSMIEEQHGLTRELERKNAELERFTYTVSHDLKSPLVTIKNFIGLLERDIRSDDRRKAYQDLERISVAADDMAALLEGLLELSRIGRIVKPPQSGRLVDLVDCAVEKLCAGIEARGVVLHIDPDMPDYWGDALRLQEVLQNLIENAVKFMGDQAEPVIRISARVEGDQTVCSISDNGIGIDPQYDERVFNLFERLDQKVEGTGIGLALVQRIIEAHHGRVWIEANTDGPGCTVVFTLPLRPDNVEFGMA